MAPIPTFDVDRFLTQFGLLEAVGKRALPNQPMVYAAVQGQDVITVGMSKSRQRLCALMGDDSLHLKKALLSLCARMRPNTPIQFYFRVMPSPSEAKALESVMQIELGTAHRTEKSSTCISGAVGYSNSMRLLLGDTNRFSEREQDLIELVVANGDIYCSLLRLERFRSSAVTIFGDYYLRQRGIAARPPPSTSGRAGGPSCSPEVSRQLARSHSALLEIPPKGLGSPAES